MASDLLLNLSIRRSTLAALVGKGARPSLPVVAFRREQCLDQESRNGRTNSAASVLWRRSSTGDLWLFSGLAPRLFGRIHVLPFNLLHLNFLLLVIYREQCTCTGSAQWRQGGVN